MKTLSFTILLLISLSACQTELHHNLDETQTNDMLAILHHADIQATKTRDQDPQRWILLVPDHQRTQAWTLLQHHGLPQASKPSLQTLFSGQSLLPSPQEERARLQAATAGELETSLLKLPHVTHARVHLVLPNHDPLTASSPTQTRASILLLTHDPKSLPPQKDIKQLITHAVDNLHPDRVSLLIQQTPPPPTITTPPSLTLKTTIPPLLFIILAQALTILWLLRRKKQQKQPTT